MVHIKLITIKRLLQARMNYPLTREEAGEDYLTCLAIALGLTSCNVTRTVTTSSQYLQRGDTTIMIQSKTIESYDASKRL